MIKTSRSLSIGDMLGTGVAMLRRYPRLWLSLYLVEFVVAAIVAWVVARILVDQFGTLPIFDRAVQGDLIALLNVLGEGRSSFAAVLLLVMGALGGYVVLSWYLIGGANAVLIQRPEARREVVECFGTGGAATFYSYFRLALWTVIPHGICFAALSVGLSLGADSLKYAITGGDVVRAVIFPLIPVAALYWLNATAIDYARIELSRRAGPAGRPDRASEAEFDDSTAAERPAIRSAKPLSAIGALVRGYRTVVTNPRPLVHVLLYGLFFASVSVVYVALTHGRPMSGATGAIAIFAIRQVVLFTRYTGKIVCAGGQVAFSQGRS
ncbi:MAG: hypothetical protein MJE77_06800 [Proteobacteria bacterium]|nr:hypothetical protein [Pseudomonadota bacterium]